MTAEYALLGDPVEHSPSPALCTAAFRSLGIDAHYTARAVASDELESAMRELAAAGGGGNVTVPHKLRAARLLDMASERVKRSGACNCFWRSRDGSLMGDNTDVGGFTSAAQRLEAAAGARLQGSRVLVLGAGGAARAVLVALGELGVAQVEVLNRRPLRADRMLATIDCEAVQLRVLPSVDEARGRYEMVINATTLGLHAGDRLPLPLSGFDTGSVFDCVYGRGGTAWTRHAEAVGLPAMDGLEMLIEQARLSIGNWVGRLPPVRAMREAATGALGG